MVLLFPRGINSRLALKNQHKCHGYSNYEERQTAVRNDISKDSKPQKYNHWGSRNYLAISGILFSFGLLEFYLALVT